ncbi:uncharacterized protein DNG_10462 [Cephalotrichum gorgonifer]|uniref:Uncharacterized protein n=1 Tax=Cephalotrichum gorgonifer TaxID=2041049 RepID=A0AAE8N9B8_9PEZI|nr:uncharacterized protein DNG_10462 [Cephalotrichum gorgonifer]
MADVRPWKHCQCHRLLNLASTSVFPENRAGRWTLYYLTGFCQASNSMFWAWTQETLSGDPATRAFASAGLNVWASLSHAVIPLAIFQTVNQPAVVAGNYGAAGFAILHTLTALSLAYLQHSRRRKTTDFAGSSEQISPGSNELTGEGSHYGPGKGTQVTVRPAQDVATDDASESDRPSSLTDRKGVRGQ